MVELRFIGGKEDRLLFRSIGIQPLKDESGCAVLVGKGGRLPPDEALYVVLPDPDAPLAETDRLAEMLGRAVGLGKLQL